MQYEEIKLGMQVKSLVSFTLVSKGSIGTVIELYKLERSRGFTIKWHDSGIKDGFGEDEIDILEFLN